MRITSIVSRLLLSALLLIAAHLVYAQGQTYRVVKDANVRSGPSTDFAKIGTVRKDTLLTVIGTTQSRKWLQVKMAGGVTGYIYAPLMAPAQTTALPVVQPDTKAATSPSVPAKTAPKPSSSKKIGAKKPAQLAAKQPAAKKSSQKKSLKKSASPPVTKKAAPSTPAPGGKASSETQIAETVTSTVLSALLGDDKNNGEQPAQALTGDDSLFLTFRCEEGVDELFYADFTDFEQTNAVILQSQDGSEVFQLAAAGEDEFWEYFSDGELVLAVNFDDEAWLQDGQGNTLFNQCSAE